MSTKFTLPPLPYAYDALGPYMSAETLEFHHDKHHQAYVTNGEKLLEGSGLEILPLEDIVKESYGKNAGLFNNAGQHYNHVHFWNWMKPNGGGNKLPGALAAKIDEDLGGFDKFRADFIAAGTTQFGSGWAWLSLKNGKLEVTKTHERRIATGPWRPPTAGRRRVGTFLLHRLPQRPPEIPRSLVRQPRELGTRRAHVRRSPLSLFNLLTEPASPAPAGFSVRHVFPSKLGILPRSTFPVPTASW